ncbi:hypothetical protein ACJX0J_031844, partial [Zea mays]
TLDKDGAFAMCHYVTAEDPADTHRHHRRRRGQREDDTGHLPSLLRRFHGVPAEERLHWRSFLVKLGYENLKGSKNEELHVASHNTGDILLIVVQKEICMGFLL